MSALPHGVVLLPSPAVRVFGYGDHPSTKRCLAWLDSHVTPGCSVADIGSGTGILAIKAALLGAGRVVAFDAGEVERDMIARNAEANGVTVEVRGLFPEEWDGTRFDLLVVNIGPDSLAYDWSEYADAHYDDATVA